MTDRELLQTIGEMDDRFIEEAAPVRRKKHKWYPWAAAAACLVLIAGLLAYSLLDGKPDVPAANGRYKYTFTQREAAALVLRWEDRILSERYLEMDFNGVSYGNRGQAIAPSLVGERLGTCDAKGYDHYSEQIYHQEFAVHSIQGIKQEKLVAVCMEGTYYVFRQDGYAPEANLGQLMEVYNLVEVLPLEQFSYHNGREKGYYKLSDDSYIWQILQECDDAPAVEDAGFTGGEHYISFTATSEALGIYKRVFYITADGYVKTNILDYGYMYHIGEEAAGRIISYAMEHSTETEPEPYTNFVAGTITEIGDGYILVNDAILCWNEADGMEFQVLTEDPVFSRWLKYHDFQVGDVVYIEYRGDMEEGNVIPGAYSIDEAIIHDGDVLIEG